MASDVHGKNHHVAGCFGRTSAPGACAWPTVASSSDVEETEPELFRATLGGMGLTGHILEVEVQLQRIPSPWIWGESERIAGVDDFIAALRAAAADWPFTVGWFDALATGRNLGRGILMKGRWATPRKRRRGCRPPRGASPCR